MTLVGQGPQQLTARQLPDLRVSGILHHLKMTHLSLGRILPPPPGALKKIYFQSRYLTLFKVQPRDRSLICISWASTHHSSSSDHLLVSIAVTPMASYSNDFFKKRKIGVAEAEPVPLQRGDYGSMYIYFYKLVDSIQLVTIFYLSTISTYFNDLNSLY